MKNDFLNLLSQQKRLNTLFGFLKITIEAAAI